MSETALRPWRELASIPMPVGVSLLKKDERGYPIPYFADTSGDRPRFWVIDPDKHRRAVDHMLCGICGYHFGGKPAAFVGGPRSIESRWFTDAAMHEECAIYALKVCPYLAAPSYRPKRLYTDGAIHFKPPGQPRPETFFMGIADKYFVLPTTRAIVIRASEWLRTEKWQQGTRVL